MGIASSSSTHARRAQTVVWPSAEGQNSCARATDGKTLGIGIHARFTTGRRSGGHQQLTLDDDLAVDL